MGGGGGGAFTPRTDDQLDLVPAGADAAVAIGSGCIAAASVAPFLMCVDRAVTAAAAGQTSSVWRGIVDNVSEFVRQPHRALRQPALWMVAGVYAGTYAAANLSDVVGERAHASANSKAAGKFTATTGANMLGGIAKDAAFARMFGAPAAGAGLVVPFASYGLFATRDALLHGRGGDHPVAGTRLSLTRLGRKSILSLASDDPGVVAPSPASRNDPRVGDPGGATLELMLPGGGERRSRSRQAKAGASSPASPPTGVRSAAARPTRGSSCAKAAVWISMSRSSRRMSITNPSSGTSKSSPGRA